MSAGKWIGGFLGWVTWGPIGALLGFILGSAVDSYIDQASQLLGNGASEDTKTYERNTYSASEQRNSFLVSLLVLSAAVIKADGKTLREELDYVREFVRKNFGEQAVAEAMRMLEQFTRQEVNIYSVGPQIAHYMNYSQRLQLFHYLVQIAVADGDFAKVEKGVLEVIGSVIGLTSTDASSVIAMFYKDRGDESAYTVLEISPSATDDEVRAAYRRMAMKYHPDRVATLGPEVQKSATEKFRQVHEAYETIKKQRGMN